jgi:uncharacterized membrane protein SirB2
MLNNEAIAYYFIKAWAAWEEAKGTREWQERSFAFSSADTHLYQAIGLAGLKWPWAYKLPRK